jgi:hypothetical protein
MRKLCFGLLFLALTIPAHAPDAQMLQAVVGNSGSINANLVGWWPINEGGSATSALDHSGYGNNGTWQGAVGCSGSHYTSTALTPFTQAGCFVLANTNYVLTTYTSRLNITGPITLSAWVYYVSRPACSEPISNLSPTNGYELVVCTGVYFQVGNAGVYKSTTQSAIGNTTWYHLCATYDGTTGTSYINGIAQSGTFTGANAIGSSSSAVALGARPSGSQPQNAYEEDARIYNSVQSCAALYAAGPHQ